MRPQLDALLPPTAQQRVAPNALAWFNELGAGRYRTVWSAMPGLVRTVGGGGTLAVADPLPSYRLQQLVPQRTGGN